MANTPETVPVKLALDVPDYQYRARALELAIGVNDRGLVQPTTIVADAAVFEEYLRNGATK